MLKIQKQSRKNIFVFVFGQKYVNIEHNDIKAAIFCYYQATRGKGFTFRVLMKSLKIIFCLFWVKGVCILKSIYALESSKTFVFK